MKKKRKPAPTLRNQPRILEVPGFELTPTPRNPLFKRGSWRFEFSNVPGVTLTLHDRTKKEAINAALSVAPGCTFHVHEIAA